MALDLDPLYHNLTMVKILRDQGSTLTAMELAEKILEEDPENGEIRNIMEDLKAEARASFERFRQGAQGTPLHAPETEGPVSSKIRKLKTLLERMEEYRRVHA